MGYPFALLFQILAAHATILCTIPCMCSVIGSSWIFVVALNDVTNDLPLLMVDGRSLKKREKTNKRFCKFVQFYVDLRELSANCSILVYLVFTNDLIGIMFFFNRIFYEYNEIFKFMATAFFAYVLFAICSIMLAIQIQLVEYISRFT